MSKFVGKFRKNKDYNDDYNYTQSKHRNEHAEIKKILIQHEEEKMLEATEATESDKRWENS